MAFTLKDFTTSFSNTFKSTVVNGTHYPGKVLYDETGAEILGQKTDARVTATDTTASTAMAIWKQISFSIQAVSDAITAIITTKYGGPSWTTVWGVAGVPFTSAAQHLAVASVTDAPTSGQKIVLDDMMISVDTAMNVTLKCETSGVVIMGPIYMPANGTNIWRSRGSGRKLATADKKLQVITSIAGNISVMAGYHSEA